MVGAATPPPSQQNTHTYVACTCTHTYTKQPPKTNLVHTHKIPKKAIKTHKQRQAYHVSRASSLTYSFVIPRTLCFCFTIRLFLIYVFKGDL